MNKLVIVLVLVLSTVGCNNQQAGDASKAIGLSTSEAQAVSDVRDAGWSLIDFICATGGTLPMCLTAK